MFFLALTFGDALVARQEGVQQLPRYGFLGYDHHRPWPPESKQGPASRETCGALCFSAAIFAAAAPGPCVLRRKIVIAAPDA